MKRVVFTVTNDLSYDQRMQRICTSLANNGYQVLLVGRVLSHSIPLKIRKFEQKRLSCFFNRGFAFYAEYNIRLLMFLLLKRGYDIVCSIDLDTLPAGYAATLIRRKKRVFDAHEYFSEVPEVVGRPFVKRFWELVARFIIPRYQHCYTVGAALARIFEGRYGVPFSVIRNMPFARSSSASYNGEPEEKIILYQGALNAGRGLETAIEAMEMIRGVRLVIAGEGDLSAELRSLAAERNLGDRIQFLGYLEPDALKQVTETAWVSLNLLENKGLSYYYSLANKFFDSVQAGVPVITMDFPEYRSLNESYEVAVLMPELTTNALVFAVQNQLNDRNFYSRMRHNCVMAAREWNWEMEEKTLLQFWQKL